MRVKFSCWLYKVTETQSHYVIIAAFHLQQWLRERALILHYTSCYFHGVTGQSSGLWIVLINIGSIVFLTRGSARRKAAVRTRPPAQTFEQYNIPHTINCWAMSAEHLVRWIINYSENGCRVFLWNINKFPVDQTAEQNFQWMRPILRLHINDRPV